MEATKTKHTPGPWELCDPMNPDRAFGISAHDPCEDSEDEKGDATQVVAEVCTGPTAEADARLIAAAPDLLAACELRRMLDQYVEPDTASPNLRLQIERRCREMGWRGEEWCLFADFIRDLADKAIARAEGRES